LNCRGERSLAATIDERISRAAGAVLRPLDAD
jgi:hypothetical protein